VTEAATKPSPAPLFHHAAIHKHYKHSVGGCTSGGAMGMGHADEQTDGQMAPRDISLNSVVDGVLC